MSYTALQDVPIQIDLTKAGNATGWTIDGMVATHEACQSGAVTLLNYPIIPGQTYKVSYAVLSISGGYVQLQAGAMGAEQTAPGLYVETITATASPLTFYSNANCQIEAFNIANVTPEDTSLNTIVYSAKTKKWSDYRTFTPDTGFGMFVKTITVNNGSVYTHENGTGQRNNFYGVQYPSFVQFVENESPVISKTFLSLSLQVNELMVTTPGGITTSLGQVSELADVDFLKNVITDGVSQILQYTKEGIYSASFLRDMNEDLLNGGVLKGNYMIIELQTTNSNVLQLFTVNVVAVKSAIGAR